VADLERLPAFDRVTPAERALRRLVAGELGLPPERLAAVDRDVLEAIERRVEALKEEAAVDEMTGVLRRTAGLDQLHREVRRAHRFDDRKLVVGFCDLDDLKVVNDTRGHAAGDAGSLVARADADYYERRRRDRWGLGRQNRQGSSAHSPAYPTPIRGVRAMPPGSGRKPSSTT
jgi:Diguanylate cyclase, GGDEF domain